MTRFSYILKSLIHNLKANLLVALGVAVSTMVLTGSLVIGDSVRYSLEQTAYYRMGNMTHLVAVTERYFRQDMAADMEASREGIKAAPVLLLEGVAVAGGGQQRVNKVQVAGVDERFEAIAGTGIYSGLSENEIIISRNLAERLNAAEGDNILVRIKKASLIPMNAPFVAAEETSVSLRAEIKKIVDEDEFGRFSIKTSQTAPYNLFISLDRLNRLMEFSGKANHVLVATQLPAEEVREVINTCLTPEDAGLKVKHTGVTGETEISTSRVFMEPPVAKMLEQLPAAKPLITYFVNGIEVKHEIQKIPGGDEKDTEGEESGIIPYSFVSSLGGNRLADDEIILNEWAASDLGVKEGDTIVLRYLEIGPLRQLTNRSAEFVLKEIVPLNAVWADSTLMPWLPGLSDAGHCREWDAGVPIDLDAIRDKDEAWWVEWKGTPKAFISLNKATQLWENRFGTYTAVRYPAGEFDEAVFQDVFSQSVDAGDLGMVVESIREQGILAARSGTDFSGLFIGLSFFILVAAVILTALLFGLNLENRSAEVGTLSALGFKEVQVRSMFMLEVFVVALLGAIAGIVFSVFYTSGVFRVLNTLWFDIVRTNVLLIKINPGTLAAGLAASTAVSLAAVYISLLRFQKRKTAELQKRTGSVLKKGQRLTLDLLMWLLLIAPFILLLMQLTGDRSHRPMLFFISGGLLLAGMLLAMRKLLVTAEEHKSGKIRLQRLSQLNLSRNRGRSLTIVVLFALGTFLVISTGSNKADLFANAEKKTSGTGGFLFFAETTMPVLYDINDSTKRAEEGIAGNFRAVQFRRVEGDDASCLNLNRIEQPAILGVDPEELSGRFSFAGSMKEVDSGNLWPALDETFEDGSIPAIADQTVIQWGLGKKVGDELLYQNERGDTLRLKLIAGTAPSVFQGYVIISNTHFLKNYPSSSGSHIFLIEGEPGEAGQISEEVNSVFRDYGWEMESAPRRLAEFYSVTNTYLSIFLALGALGMILGTIGLAVILARTVLERRHEIALMQAVGFSRRQLFGYLVNEYVLLLAAGVLTGFATAVVATLPSFVSANTDASLETVALITGIIMVNGLIWIAVLSWFSLRRNTLISGLRSE